MPVKTDLGTTKSHMNKMQRVFIALVIGVILVALGTYLYNNSQNKSAQITQTGEFSTVTNNYPVAEQSEVVELKNGDTYNLTASIVKKNIKGNEVKMLAYNGSIPGPLLKIPQEAEITLNFKNEIDVPTTIHSHGIRLDNKFDGVPDITQKEVGVGESFTYKIKFPDAGIYWYHPHIREDYAQELGLYGNYLVTPIDTNYWSPVNREVALFLDDILIENGKISPFYTKTVNHTLMGRYGNVMLINGENNYTLQAKKGEVIRFYITNSANTRPFNFTIAGAKMKLVGGDSGAYEKDQWVDAVTLGPSERAIIEVLFEKAGSYAFQNKTPDKTYEIGIIAVSEDSVASSYADSFAVLKTHNEAIKSIDPFRAYFSKESDKKIKLSIELNGDMQKMMGVGSAGGGHMMADGTMMGGNMMEAEPKDGIEWENSMQMMSVIPDTSMVKWKISDQASGKENMDIDWKFKVGDKVKIRITNDPKSMHPMQHPIHIHGQRFLVVKRNGIQNQNLVWKDTVLVQNGDTVELLVDMDNPGDWVIHCHIPEHMEAGMMSQFKVLNRI